MAAMFLRHEGFLGAVGAFLKVHSQMTGATQPQKVRRRGQGAGAGRGKGRGSRGRGRGSR